MNGMSLGMALIGIGGLAAGVVGILLPPSHRFAALLALVAGAGVGVLTLAFTMREQDANEDVFLIGAALGLATVVVTLAAAWRRSVADR